jgi:tetratricopeptide (TPR) repeat protein
MEDNFESNENTEKDLKAALDKYEDMIKRSRKFFFDHDVFVQLIEHYDERNDMNKALEACDYAIEQYPFSAELLLKKAQLLTDLEKYQAALKILDKAAGLAPGDTNVVLMKSDILMLQNNFQQAVEILQDGLNNVSEEKDVFYLEIADVYFEWNHMDDAFFNVKKALELNPDNEYALNRIWYLVEVTDRFEESAELHKNIIEEHPFCYSAWTNLAQAYTGLDLYEKALECCEYAIVINENIDTAHRDAGEILILMNRYREALEYFSKVQALNLPDAYLYFNIGYCYEKLKEYTTARNFYLRSTQINKNFAEGYFQVAEIYSKLNEWVKAIPYYRTAVKLNDNYLPYYTKYAKALLHGNQPKDALKVYQQLLDHNPRKKNWWVGIITASLFLGKEQDAEQACRHAFSYLGDQMELQYINALLLYLNGKIVESKLLFENLLAFNFRKHKILFEVWPDLKDDQFVSALILEAKAEQKRNKNNPKDS